MTQRHQQNDVAYESDTIAEVEKDSVVHAEQVNTGRLSAVDAAFLANFSEAQRKTVLKKVDWRLVPMLLVLYLISFIDRANIGNAKIEGLVEDLNMTGTEYNIALAIFFIPYTLAEVPSNAILNMFNRPSVFMGTIITVWGIVMTCHGFVNSFAELCGVRVLLGLFEYVALVMLPTKHTLAKA